MGQNAEARDGYECRCPDREYRRREAVAQTGDETESCADRRKLDAEQQRINMGRPAEPRPDQLTNSPADHPGRQAVLPPDTLVHGRAAPLVAQFHLR